MGKGAPGASSRPTLAAFGVVVAARGRRCSRSCWWRIADAHTTAGGQAHGRGRCRRRALERLTIDLETGLRGRLLTGEDRFLLPYRDAPARTSRSSCAGCAALVNDPAQRARLAALERRASSATAPATRDPLPAPAGDRRAASRSAATAEGKRRARRPAQPRSTCSAPRRAGAEDRRDAGRPRADRATIDRRRRAAVAADRLALLLTAPWPTASLASACRAVRSTSAARRGALAGVQPSARPAREAECARPGRAQAEEASRKSSSWPT